MLGIKKIIAKNIEWMYYEYDYRSKYARIFPKRAKRFSFFVYKESEMTLK